MFIWRLSLLHNFIHQSLNSGSVQVQILLAAFRRFSMARISDNGLPTGNKAKHLSLVNHTAKTIHHHHIQINKHFTAYINHAGGERGGADCLRKEII